MKNIVVLTGAGMSAESGIKTFRDAGGLWEGFEIEEVATPGAFEKNPKQGGERLLVTSLDLLQSTLSRR